MLNPQLGMPGVRAQVSTVTREIFWGGDAGRIKILRGQGQFSNTLRDAGGDPTTQIRPGLLLGALTADSKLVHWNPAATDGSEILRGVNEHELSMVEGFGSTAAERFGPYVLNAPLKASQLLVLGVALTSSTFQYLARRRLALAGCILDDDPFGYLAGINPRTIPKTATGAITAAENGGTFIVKGAAAVTLTLPTLVPGLSFKFLNIAAQNLIIASAGSLDDIVTINDLSADTITFSTAGQLIGAQAEVYSDYVDGVLKWISTVQIGAATIA
jgi:hypothetical protein